MIIKILAVILISIAAIGIIIRYKMQEKKEKDDCSIIVSCIASYLKSAGVKKEQCLEYVEFLVEMAVSIDDMEYEEITNICRQNTSERERGRLIIIALLDRNQGASKYYSAGTPRERILIYDLKTMLESYK